MRGTPRGSTQRTSFIDYVSEVYNSTKGQTTPKDGNLSVRGHSISSSSVASGSSLARDLSVRSENVQSTNRVLGGRLRGRDATKSARLATGGSRNLSIFAISFDKIMPYYLLFHKKIK